ncbi:GGDEF domain-containing response regulator [Desulfovibrio inopinatus]|uniref:GGDEF domain-containing response regulator n=1 Tax=Desulfovibrio inopinatus TaxID=102109 RepID=UPI00040871BB|nr:diguanylate cyclase [Desulfovibrio inopinatus]
MYQHDMISRPHILLVDDMQDNLMILAESLKNRYILSSATNGITALKYVHENPPDLILLDIMMPGMSGYDVLKRLKADESSQHIPVIFITALGDEQEETMGLHMGAVDYIRKPFSPAVVNARVETHLELKRKTDLLERLASFDSLTGLANRRRFDEYLGRSWRQCTRSSSSLALIMGDIDFFKEYNDCYGHTQGDQCLRDVAQALLLSARRPTDLVARYGGEEFTIMLPETDCDGAMAVAQNILHNVNQLHLPHATSSCSKHVTISLGVAVTRPAQATSSASLLQGADAMLYEAKAHGRNRVYGPVTV